MLWQPILGSARTAPMATNLSIMNRFVLPSFPTVQIDQRRWASNLGPRRTKYRKSQKGRVPFPIGGSVKGTTVSQGIYGLRTLQPCRLSAMQLSAAETVLKRKLKVVRGSQVFMRVFPDVPVCVKGNETRMGKGKGTFEFWACRVPVGRVLFEIGGHVEVRPEVAKEGMLNESDLALRLAAAKLPIRTEFITASTPPRLGREVDVNLASARPSIKAET